MAGPRLIASILLLTGAAALAAQHAPDRPAVVLDENIWVAFYDLPSRRFREIRSAILTQNFSAAARDLEIAASYVEIEAARSIEPLREPLDATAARLRELAGNADTVSLADLDRAFGRTHWLLAQHFIAEARTARDARQARLTGLNLWAATHHMERTLLWSDVAVSREVRKTLDRLRDMAGRLQRVEKVEAVYRERPVVRAEELLKEIGRQVDRPVRLPRG